MCYLTTNRGGLRYEEVIVDWGVVVCGTFGGGMCHGFRLGESGDRRFDDYESRGHGADVIGVSVLGADVSTATVPQREAMSDVAGGAVVASIECSTDAASRRVCSVAPSPRRGLMTICFSGQEVAREEDHFSIFAMASILCDRTCERRRSRHGVGGRARTRL